MDSTRHVDDDDGMAVEGVSFFLQLLENVISQATKSQHNLLKWVRKKIVINAGRACRVHKKFMEKTHTIGGKNIFAVAHDDECN